jgi:hypothetical protein
MTLTANGDVLKASLNKVNDSNGIIQDLGGILPPRECSLVVRLIFHRKRQI